MFESKNQQMKPFYHVELEKNHQSPCHFEEETPDFVTFSRFPSFGTKPAFTFGRQSNTYPSLSHFAQIGNLP